MSTPASSVVPVIQIPGINNTDPAFSGAAVLSRPTQYDQTLGTALATTATRSRLSCKALLGPDSLRDAEREAAVLFPKMFADVTVLLSYGNGAVAPLNDLNRQLLTRVKPVRVPEMMALLRELNGGMDAIAHKYDFTGVNDQNMTEFYDQWKKKFLGWWHRGKSIYDLFMQDVRSMESQLDKVSQTLSGKELEMIEFNAFYDVLYGKTNDELHELVFTIAVMEIIVELAVDAASKITIGDKEAGDQGETERMRYSNLANNLNIRLTEFKGRLGLGWANCPMILTAQSVDVSQAVRLNSLVNIGIPSMENYLLSQRMLLEQLEGSQFDDLVSGVINRWVQAAAGSFGTNIPIMAKRANEPTLVPATFGALAKAMADAANGMVAAISNADRERAELEAAAVQCRNEVATAAGQINQAVVDTVIARAHDLQVNTSVPALTSGGQAQVAGLDPAADLHSATELPVGPPTALTDSSAN